MAAVVELVTARNLTYYGDYDRNQNNSEYSFNSYYLKRVQCVNSEVLFLECQLS